MSIAGKVLSIVNAAGIKSTRTFRDVQGKGTVYKVKCPIWDNSVPADAGKVNAALDGIHKEFGDDLIDVKLLNSIGSGGTGTFRYQSIVAHLKRKQK